MEVRPPAAAAQCHTTDIGSHLIDIEIQGSKVNHAELSRMRVFTGRPQFHLAASGAELQYGYAYKPVSCMPGRCRRRLCRSQVQRHPSVCLACCSANYAPKTGEQSSTCNSHHIVQAAVVNSS